jgi:biopolymer transport protein ExbD
LAQWDVFHSDRLETERNLSTDDVLAALARGALTDDDLVRPAGATLRWARLADAPEFADRAVPIDPFEPPTIEGPTRRTPIHHDDDYELHESESGEFEVDDDEDHSLFDPLGTDVSMAESLFEAAPVSGGEIPRTPIPPPPSGGSVEAHPVLPDDQVPPGLPELDDFPAYDSFEVVDDERAEFVPEDEELHEEEFDPQEEDDEAAEFSLSRKSALTVEELDLAAMVDVAFQLVLFFLVTAQTIVFKTLEVPKPNDDKPPEAAAQAKSKTIDELEKDFILVEVDAAGNVKVDRQAVPADRTALADRLRSTRQTTGRTAMLISTDYGTKHKNAVLVEDVANEVDLRIAFAMPARK